MGRKGEEEEEEEEEEEVWGLVCLLMVAYLMFLCLEFICFI